MKGNYHKNASAGAGSIVVNDTTEKVINAAGFLVLEDTVVARIEINGDTTTDVKANYITTAATALKAGAYIAAQGDDYISAVTLTSGSINLVLY